MICINCLKEGSSLPMNQNGEVLCTKKCKDEYKEWWKAFKAEHRQIARELEEEKLKKLKQEAKTAESVKEQNRVLTERRLAKEALRDAKKGKKSQKK